MVELFARRNEIEAGLLARVDALPRNVRAGLYAAMARASVSMMSRAQSVDAWSFDLREAHSQIMLAELEAR